ncbi:MULTISPECIES: hypothetical protein [Streptomyces]|uniref:hypothetical protein n=1 Tax=Streptomyces TaxID=1883 RepID=UPI00210D1532|nr:hypothetical protein [Streptomyces longispororuber]MCQ4207481.1 hypothetical protein [Streptomyces longispororuber]
MSTRPDTFLPLHTAVVLLTAAVMGLVIGCLTVHTGAPVAAAVIAGLSSAGAAVPVLRTLIGRPPEAPRDPPTCEPTHMSHGTCERR